MNHNFLKIKVKLKQLTMIKKVMNFKNSFKCLKVKQSLLNQKLNKINLMITYKISTSNKLS